MKISIWKPSLTLFILCLILTHSVCISTRNGMISKPGKDYRKLKSKASLKGEYVPQGSSKMTKEPSCEELRAMWRFSKRQSRAAEITNEIPQYRDPFYTNSWSDFTSSRGNRPMYGRVVHSPSVNGNGANSEPGRARAFEEVVRMFGAPHRNPTENRRRPQSRKTFRIFGGYSPDTGDSPLQAGSFQELRDIVRAEKIKELEDKARARGDEIPGGKDDVVVSPEAIEDEYGRIVHTPSAGPFGQVLVEVPTAFETVRYGPSGRYQDSPMAQMAAAAESRKQMKGIITYPDMSGKSYDTMDEMSDEPAEDSRIYNRAGGQIAIKKPRDLSTFREMGIKTGKNKHRSRGRNGQTDCDDIEHQKCYQHSDCACVSDSIYRCSAGRCQVLPITETDRFGTWHSGSLAEDQLGVWQNRGT